MRTIALKHHIGDVKTLGIHMWPQKSLSPAEAEAAAIAEAASSAFRSARNVFLNIATRNTENSMATNSPTAPSRAYDQNNTTQAVNQNPELRQERTLVLEGLGQGYRAQTHSRRSQGTLKYQDAPHRVQSQNRAERTPLSAAPLLPRGTSSLSSPLANSISSMLCAGEILQTSTPFIDPTPSIHQTSCQYSILRHQFHTIPSSAPRATSRIRLTSSPISSSISAPATTSSTQSTPLPLSISEGSPPLPDQRSEAAQPYDPQQISISQLENDLRQKRCALFRGAYRDVYIYPSGIGYKIYRHVRDDVDTELSYDLRLNDIYQSKYYNGKMDEFANVEICNVLDDRAKVNKTIKVIKFKHKGFEQLASSDRIPLSLITSLTNEGYLLSDITLTNFAKISLDNEKYFISIDAKYIGLKRSNSIRSLKVKTFLTKYSVTHVGWGINYDG